MPGGRPADKPGMIIINLIKTQTNIDFALPCHYKNCKNLAMDYVSIPAAGFSGMICLEHINYLAGLDPKSRVVDLRYPPAALAKIG